MRDMNLMQETRGTSNNNNNNINNNDNNNINKKQTVAIPWVPTIGPKIKKNKKSLDLEQRFKWALT